MTATLHPIFQQALAPFLMPAAMPKRTYKAPPAESGLVVFEWSTDCDEPIVCHLDYSPAERGSREPGTGLQMEPDEPEQITLGAAYLLDVDILYLLCPQQVAEIERLALREMQS